MDIFTKETLKFFKEISLIPRESGNEEGISNYLVNFAKERNLKVYKDKFNNVIIYKRTNTKLPIILQSHQDMVCVKSPNSKTDFKIDGIQIKKCFGNLYANKTTLGADNGIGVAIILAILNSNLKVNIEAVFTTEEETTMQGAFNINHKKLIAKNMICLDGFNKNTITVSTAGFADFLVTFDKSETSAATNLNSYKILVSGLKGGHSGFDIDKNRGSSHKIMAEFLLKLKNFKLVNICGGHNFNVIPSSTSAEILSSMSSAEMENCKKEVLQKYKKQFNCLNITVSQGTSTGSYLTYGKNLINFISSLQEGVLERDDKGFITSSLCLSEIDFINGNLKIGIRNSTNDGLKALVKKLTAFCKKFKLTGEMLSSQSAFNSFENSNLVKLLLKTNKHAKVDKLHITTECGVFQSRNKNLDVAIISPTIKHAHSIHETVNIKSIKQTIQWLLKFLNAYYCEF